jgi:hypothetical protein
MIPEIASVTHTPHGQGWDAEIEFENGVILTFTTKGKRRDDEAAKDMARRWYRRALKNGWTEAKIMECLGREEDRCRVNLMY